MNALRAPILAAVLAVLAAPAQAHSLYSGTYSPGSIGVPCCDGTHCGPRETRPAADGGVEILIRGQWWPARGPRWYVGPSHDGVWHGCMLPQDSVPRCVFGDGEKVASTR